MTVSFDRRVGRAVTGSFPFLIVGVATIVVSSSMRRHTSAEIAIASAPFLGSGLELGIGIYFLLVLWTMHVVTTILIALFAKPMPIRYWMLSSLAAACFFFDGVVATGVFVPQEMRESQPFRSGVLSLLPLFVVAASVVGGTIAVRLHRRVAIVH